MAALDPLETTIAIIGPPVEPDSAEARREEAIGVFDCVRALCVHLIGRGICTPAELAALFSNQATTGARFSSHRALPAHLLANEMTQLCRPDGVMLS